MISSQLSWVSLPVFCLQLSVDVAPEASSNRDQIIHVSGTNCIRNWFICLASTMELKLLACSIPSEIFIQWDAFSVHLCLFFRSLRSRMRANRRLWGSIIRNRGLYWTESVHCSSSSVRYTRTHTHKPAEVFSLSIWTFWPHATSIQATPEKTVLLFHLKQWSGQMRIKFAFWNRRNIKKCSVKYTHLLLVAVTFT